VATIDRRTKPRRRLKVNDVARASSLVAVIGAGPAGLTAAVALAGAGQPTTLVAGRPKPDNRTTALLASSITALDTIGVWCGCRPSAAPLRTLRIVDCTRRLWRAPEIKFSASEIGLEAFGWNIENRHLVAALAARARALPNLLWIDDAACSIVPADQSVTVALTCGDKIVASLVVGADGQNSLCREAARIDTIGWSYPQTALTLNLGHTRPHHDASTEFHTESGPFTFVPLPGLRSSLVAVVAPREVARWELDDPAVLAETIEQRSHSILGKVMVEPGHGKFPLAVRTARRFGANRIALVGEAAHVIPPIGAQGLNLGLRDAATIAELAVHAHRMGRDIGSAAVVDRYEHIRRADVTTRTVAVDALNRSLLSDFLPVQGARSVSLFLLDRIGPLRRAAMREGTVPAASQPRLMRGEAL
jgi:2-octaprenyl-6-methoxyphenol hydroxylase